ncbi:DNA ligase [Nocardioides yefusunii]|uniref:DNA ligase (ATP) n=1 Tax=Nocardioides yefusunii TaxID=2500546 RepID=A0ABW1QVS6_9ACTN|nr:DNA ligase [Nocardioides yefusunii]
MLAMRGDRLPEGPGWCHEVKWDGVRALVVVSTAGTRILTRNGNDVTAAVVEFAGLRVAVPGHAPVEAVLDAELVAMVDGRPSFQAVMSRLRGGSSRAAARSSDQPRAALVLVVFDLLASGGQDLTGLTLQDRRALLEELSFLPGVTPAGSDSVPGAVMRSPIHDDVRALWDATAAQGLEGVISKRWDSTYETGVRSTAWLKFPHRTRTSWVVGGWRPELGGDRAGGHRIGALLLGEPRRGPSSGPPGLFARGAVGSGITGQQEQELRALLAAIPRRTSPFIDLSAAEETTAVWVEPALVVDVESLGFTENGRLRQASFAGVRADLGVEDLLADPQSRPVADGDGAPGDPTDPTGRLEVGGRGG